MLKKNINRWLFTPNPLRFPRMRLFCLPYAGGGSSFFYKWHELLSPPIEVICIRLPGREKRLNEAPFKNLSLLSKTLVSVLKPYLDTPFAFYGHSLGGLISYEVTRRLSKEGLNIPEHVFIAAENAPHLMNQLMEKTYLSDKKFIMRVNKYGGITKQMLDNPELRELLLTVLRADFEMIDTYEYSKTEKIDSPITVLGGIHDPVITQEGLLGWEAYTRNKFNIEYLEGDHFFVHQSEKELLSIIRNELSSKMELFSMV